MTLESANDKNPAQYNDFFALFNLPVQFAIDEAELDLQYRALQKQYHPDKLVETTTASQQSETSSSGYSAAVQGLLEWLKSSGLKTAV